MCNIGDAKPPLQFSHTERFGRSALAATLGCRSEPSSGLPDFEEDEFLGRLNVSRRKIVLSAPRRRPQQQQRATNSSSGGNNNKWLRRREITAERKKIGIERGCEWRLQFPESLSWPQEQQRDKFEMVATAALAVRASVGRWPSEPRIRSEGQASGRTSICACKYLPSGRRRALSPARALWAGDEWGRMACRRVGG